MTPDRLIELEFEALQQEKRDKLNARLQIWSLLVGLIGASGVASLQSGTVAYVILLYPLVAACVARYAGHSESVLCQVKAYLLKIERRTGHIGYEQYNLSSGRSGVGGHMKALRDAILLTDGLAITVVAWRMVADGWPWLLVSAMIALVLAVIWVTCRWLNNGRERAQ